MPEKATNELTRLKKDIPLLSLVASAGIEVKKLAGGEYAALCPFHEDKTPSLHINPDKNVFHCKGCGKSGTPVDWVMHMKGVNAGEAIRILRAMLPAIAGGHGNISDPSGQEKKNGADVLESVDLTRPDLQKALQICVDWYSKSLKSSHAAVDALMKRGLRFGELVEEFKIGHCDGTLVSKTGDGELIKNLYEIGILKREDGRLVERFVDCLIFPVADENNIITGLYGRSLLPGKAGRHIYLPGPHRGIFNVRAFVSKEIIITESIIDALSLMTLGYRNVIAAYGAQGFTDEMKARMTRTGTEKLYVAFDSDNGGRLGTEKIVEKLKDINILIYRIHFPEGYDPNDFIRKTEDAGGRFKDLLNNSSLISSGKNAAGKTPTGRGALSDAPPFEKKDGEYRFSFGDRAYISRGLEKNNDDTTLKTFLKAALGTKFHIDTLDLFNAKACWFFVRSAAESLGLDERVIRADLDRIVPCLDSLLKTLLNEKAKEKPEMTVYRVNLAARQRADEFLSLPDFIVLLLELVQSCALVGENLNVLFGLIATLTRYTADQIHIIIQSESSTGKSTLLNLLSEFVPEEDRLYFTQITPKSFYHAQEGSMKNKSVFIVEMQGLSEAHYPIQQMMSEKKLVNVYTMTDPKTGRFMNETKVVEGPDQFSITCPTEGITDDINNRSAILTMDQSQEQLARVMQFQRMLLSPEGAHLRRQRQDLIDLVQHVQRALTIRRAVNPHVLHLFYGADTNRSLRDHQRYLTLIEAITILFQKQRETVMIEGRPHVKTHIIDIHLANFMARRVSGRSLSVLPPQTGNFVSKIAGHFLEYAKEKDIAFTQIWFYRRDMQKITKLSTTRTHEHAQRLVTSEYMATKRDPNGIAYRFLFEPDMDGSFATLFPLADIREILKKVGRKEREEYSTFLPTLHRIFLALDPSWEEGRL